MKIWMYHLQATFLPLHQFFLVKPYFILFVMFSSFILDIFTIIFDFCKFIVIFWINNMCLNKKKKREKENV